MFVCLGGARRRDGGGGSSANNKNKNGNKAKAKPVSPYFVLDSAIEKGELAKVKKLLESGLSVNGADPLETEDGERIKSVRPIHKAATYKQLEVLKFLLSAGARVDVSTPEWNGEYGAQTPLDKACAPVMSGPSSVASARADVVRALLEVGADPLGFWSGIIPPPLTKYLHQPRKKDLPPECTALPNCESFPPLPTALQPSPYNSPGYLQNTEEAAREVANVFLSNPKYMEAYPVDSLQYGIAVRFAIERGLVDIVKTMLSQYGAPELKYLIDGLCADFVHKRGPEFDALKAEMFRVLLDAGVDPNYYSMHEDEGDGISMIDDYPFLLIVADCGNMETARVLIERGADVDEAHDHDDDMKLRRNAIDDAIKQGHHRVAEFLQDREEHKRLREAYLASQQVVTG